MAGKTKLGHRQNLRELFIAGEKLAQTDEALLELLLTYAIPQKDVQPLAGRLIADYGSLSDVLAGDLETLCRMEGIKSYSAVLLKLVDWIRSHHPSRKPKQLPPSLPKTSQAALFDLATLKQEQSAKQKEKKPARQKKVSSRRGTGLFGKAILKEATELLPALPDTDSLSEAREYLRRNLHYSSEQTRQRYANYIIRRIFPNGIADRAIRIFAGHFRESQSLREVCFYRFMRAEPLMQQVVQELLIPRIGNGWLNRQKIKDYLGSLFPSSRSIVDGTKAIVDALRAGGIAEINQGKITFSYRNIFIPSFAFILHSEFPDQGMYDIKDLEANSIIKAMLWHPDRILPSLYELRNLGIISKVSEIDNVRQFTLKWNLDQVVAHLVKTD